MIAQSAFQELSGTVLALQAYCARWTSSLSRAKAVIGKSLPNKACTRPLEEHQDYSGGSLRVFRHFSWLEVGSVKVALSRPAHQRVTHTVGLFIRAS
jgi:hypothetical protein